LINTGMKTWSFLQARKSLVIDEDDAPLSTHDLDALSKSETYSVTSEDSYTDKKGSRGRRRPESAGAKSLDREMRRNKTHSLTSQKSEPALTSRQDQGTQMTIGKGNYERLKETYDIEEGQPKKEKEKSKLSKIFAKKKGGDDPNANYLESQLPQVFLVKYMGNRSTKGYGGAKYTTGPVEEIVEAVGQMPKGSDLPLVGLEVSLEGLKIAPHKKNKVKSFEGATIPIKFISYGAQDQNYPRIFACIMVREMSARTKKLDCHVYACDSSKNARRLAACLSFAFQHYSEMMNGRPAQFSAEIHKELHLQDDDTRSSYDV